MLYSILIGVVIGLLVGGRPGRLADLRLEWIWVALVALVLQTLIFTPGIWHALGELVPPIYVGSTAVVLVVVVRNLRHVRGLWFVAIGTACNLSAIIANGGYMPVTAEALGIAEPTVTRYGGNSVLTADPQLALLVDRFMLPDWLPMATAFSIGDVLISVGIAIVVIIAMRGGAHGRDQDATSAADPRLERSTNPRASAS